MITFSSSKLYDSVHNIIVLKWHIRLSNTKPTTVIIHIIYSEYLQNAVQREIVTHWVRAPARAGTVTDSLTVCDTNLPGPCPKVLGLRVHYRLDTFADYKYLNRK